MLRVGAVANEQVAYTLYGGVAAHTLGRAGGMARAITVRDQQAVAYTTGAGISLFWNEADQPYAIVGGLIDVYARAESLEALDLAAWQRRRG